MSWARCGSDRPAGKHLCGGCGGVLENRCPRGGVSGATPGRRRRTESLARGALASAPRAELR